MKQALVGLSLAITLIGCYCGQGGLGDVILSPDFATTQDIYLSYAEADEAVTS